MHDLGEFPFKTIPKEAALHTKARGGVLIEGSKTHQLALAIWENEKLRGTPKHRTVSELALDLGTTQPYLYSVRRRLHLRTRGMTALGKHDRSQGMSPEQLLEYVKSEPILNTIERQQLLSHLAKTGAPMIRIAALRALREGSGTEENRLGPPEPATPEEYAERLARLLLGVGRERAEAAMLLAYPPEVALAP